MEIEGNGLCGEVLREDYLELPDGRIIKNMVGLIEALKEMNDEEFSLHVSRHYNDFAEWILEAYGEEELAGKIGKIKNRGRMIKLLCKVLDKAERGRFDRGKKGETLKKIGEMG